jgi:hypothetical protein
MRMAYDDLVGRPKYNRGMAHSVRGLRPSEGLKVATKRRYGEGC